MLNLGCNWHRQLGLPVCGNHNCKLRIPGHGTNRSEPSPQLIQALIGKHVVGTYTSAGKHHTLAWTKNGEISIGAQPKKTNRREDEHEPKLIEGALKGQKVIDASAGGGQSLVVTKGGPAFSVIAQLPTFF